MLYSVFSSVWCGLCFLFPATVIALISFTCDSVPSGLKSAPFLCLCCLCVWAFLCLLFNLLVFLCPFCGFCTSALLLPVALGSLYISHYKQKPIQSPELQFACKCADGIVYLFHFAFSKQKISISGKHKDMIKCPSFCLRRDTGVCEQVRSVNMSPGFSPSIIYWSLYFWKGHKTSAMKQMTERDKKVGYFND